MARKTVRQKRCIRREKSDSQRYPPGCLRLVWVPPPVNGKPSPRACRHLALTDKSGRTLRFVKQSWTNLITTPGGEEVLRERERRREVRRFIREMKAMGFYQDR